MKNEIIDFLRTTFLFQDIDEDSVVELCSCIHPQIVTYTKNSDVFASAFHYENIAFLIDGECVVERVKPDGETIPLNLLKSGESFGILSAFSSEEFPTRIKATKDSTILFISKEDLMKLLNLSPNVAINTIMFLTKKISFLNKKIAMFSSSTACEKLASHLHSQYLKAQNEELQFNCKRTAEVLNIGRASLYRALEELEAKKIIRFETKKIYIKDPIGLERISK